MTDTLTLGARTRVRRPTRGSDVHNRARAEAGRSGRTPTATGDQRHTISMLEGAAIARGAAALTVAQLDAAQLTNTLLRRNLKAVLLPTAAELARSFHRQLVGACPNQHMVRLLDAQAQASALLPDGLTPESIGRAADEHDELLTMVRSGTPLIELERFARNHVGSCCGCAA